MGPALLAHGCAPCFEQSGLSPRAGCRSQPGFVFRCRGYIPACGAEAGQALRTFREHGLPPRVRGVLSVRHPRSIPARARRRLKVLVSTSPAGAASGGRPELTDLGSLPCLSGCCLGGYPAVPFSRLRTRERAAVCTARCDWSLQVVASLGVLWCSVSSSLSLVHASLYRWSTCFHDSVGRTSAAAAHRLHGRRFSAALKR